MQLTVLQISHIPSSIPNKHCILINTELIYTISFKQRAEHKHKMVHQVAFFLRAPTDVILIQRSAK